MTGNCRIRAVQPGKHCVPMVTTPMRALILPVMLLIIALLAVLSASFAFHMRAHSAAVNATANRLQLRLAAEAGIQNALLLLRENRHDVTLWYDNDELFHNRVVWSMVGDEAERDVPEDVDPSKITFRYSLVADDPYDDVVGVRYGLTDEASKLNINMATPTQLRTLFAAVLPEDVEIEPLVDALIDWRDADDEPRGQGAESEYYTSLEPPYTVKNNVFETVEELLLVKGFTARVLFGEDYDRNGLLSLNEDDGDEFFPPDNEDGFLDRGIYPFITVWSRDLNRSNDNVSRINLNGEAREVQQQMQDLGIFDDAVIEFVANARRNGATFTSPIQLFDYSYTPGSNKQNRGGSQPPQNRNDVPADDGKIPDEERQQIEDILEDSGVDVDLDQALEEGGSRGRRPNQNRTRGRPAEGSEEGSADEQMDEPTQPALVSPVTLADLPDLCDYTTTVLQPGLMGLVNINTAPREVLMCLTNGQFTEVDVDAMIAVRQTLDPVVLETTAWPLTEDVISKEALDSIYAQITTRSQQFSIEAIGHADHLGMMVRLQAIVELRGHVPQYMYYRDVTQLGTYPIRGTREGENVVRNRRR